MGLFSRKKITTQTKEEKADLTKKKTKANLVNKDNKKEEKTSMKDLYNLKGEVKEAKGKKKEIKYGLAYKILIKPLVTEKVSNLGAVNKYVFEVAANANKIEVAKAIHEVYGIKPIKINIIKIAGKKAGYGRITGKRKNWKKAIVSLPAGESIKVYEGV